MTIMTTSSISPAERLATRFEELRTRYGFKILDAESFAVYTNMPGTSLIMFAEDPAKVPETWDLTIILPELVDASVAVRALRVGLLPPEAARPLAARYGLRLWPALLAVRGGAYLGAIEGLKDWHDYARLLPELLAAEPSRPPSIGIPVHNANASIACH